VINKIYRNNLLIIRYTTSTYNMENNNKSSLYNTVFSLVEEELHHRLNPSGYSDKKFDGTNVSICGSSNLDMSTLGNEGELMAGGGLSAKNKDKYIPGKFDAIRNSYNIPLSVALKGTIERQKLFLQEKTQVTKN
jgi:hypothetical protein